MNRFLIHNQFLEAAETSNTKAIQSLIKAGANINIKSSDFDYTPLHIALIRKMSIAALKLLLDAGADVNAKNHYGLAPLHVAASNGCLETVKLLLEAGANIHVQNISEETALDYTVKEGHRSIAKLLIMHGINPIINNVKNERGKTIPLHAEMQAYTQSTFQYISTKQDKYQFPDIKTTGSYLQSSKGAKLWLKNSTVSANQPSPVGRAPQEILDAITALVFGEAKITHSLNSQFKKG